MIICVIRSGALSRYQWRLASLPENTATRLVLGIKPLSQILYDTIRVVNETLS